VNLLIVEYDAGLSCFCRLLEKYFILPPTVN
jgi:hypothetical protein